MKFISKQRQALAICLIAIVGIVLWVTYATKKTSDNEGGNNEPSQLAESISTYFVFNNGDPDDFFQGSQFFGNQDKLGISKPVLAAFPNRTSDFLAIANNHEVRKQWLESQGANLDLVTDHWLVQVMEAGDVNGDKRVSVIALLGHDEERDGGIGMHASHSICEIWKLNSPGDPPRILDRSRRRQVGLATVEEVPLPQPPEIPSVMFEGTAENNDDPFKTSSVPH